MIAQKAVPLDPGVNSLIVVPLVVTDDDVVRVGQRNAGWKVERIAGELVMTPPSGWKSDARAFRAALLLQQWAEKAGGIVTASSGGSKPGNGDLVSPDAAWVSASRWDSLTDRQQEGFLPFAPDVVIEVVSASDRQKHLSDKCQRWFDGGTSYVILIDPYRKTIRTWGDPPAADFPDFAPVLEI
jgi:Uma2 family endonuclease